MSGAASPAPSETEAAKRAEVAYRFCQECSNLLYPKEDKETATLLYFCKACKSVAQHDSACTFRQHLGSTVQETAGVTTDVANDPTVGDALSEMLPLFCTLCGEPLKCAHCGRHETGPSNASDTGDLGVDTSIT